METLRMTTIDKRALRDTLLSLEAVSVEQARKLYEDFLSTARLNRAEQMDEGDRSQAEHAAAVAGRLEEQIHVHLSHRKILESLPLHPVKLVDRGAIVTVNGRTLVLAVPTQPFTFQGIEILGISCEAPLAKAMFGLGSGDSIDFEETKLVIEAVQ
jgi:transcription elongation GreA/GreB family factor